MTDKTEYPAFWCGYLGSDLVMDATHPCHLRTSGAQNWEAYIKDARDGKIYRVVQSSDNSWWFASPLDVNEKVHGICKYAGDGIDYKGYAPNNKPDCPSGWSIPTMLQTETRWPDPYGINLGTSDPYGGGWFELPYSVKNGGCAGSGAGKNLHIVADCINGMHYSGTGQWSGADNFDCNRTDGSHGTRVYCMKP
jgi:hypothetical protein